MESDNVLKSILNGTVLSFVAHQEREYKTTPKGRHCKC